MSNRLEQWINASHGVGKIEPFMVIQIQGIGRIDSTLFENDRKYISMKLQGENKSPEEWSASDLTDSVTLSYLWVLGAYEIIRSLNERLKIDQSSAQYQKSLALKKLFSRIRVPLAKLEAEGRHKKTDSKVAWPLLTPEHGIA